MKTNISGSVAYCRNNKIQKQILPESLSDKKNPSLRVYINIAEMVRAKLSEVIEKVKEKFKKKKILKP